MSGAVLVFVGILFALQTVYQYLPFKISYALDTVLTSLIYAGSYFLTAIIYTKIYKNDVSPIRFIPKNGENVVPLLFASLAVTVSISHLQGILSGGGSIPEFDVYHGTEIIALFFSTVIVPAFCEELFFRGIILTNLLPVGRGFAIITSGIIFGLAHGNHDQIFFAAMTGIVIGWLYVETDSLWLGIMLHLINNMIATAQTVLLGLIPYEKAFTVIYAGEFTVLLLGAISVIYLLFVRKNHESDTLCDGSFGRLLPSFRTLETHASTAEYIRGFFSPVMIVFLCYVVLSEVLYVIYI